MEVTFSDLSSRKYSKSAPVAASGRHFILPTSPQEYSSTAFADLCRPGWTLWTVAQKPERGAQSKDSWSALSQYLDGTVLISLRRPRTPRTPRTPWQVHCKCFKLPSVSACTWFFGKFRLRGKVWQSRVGVAGVTSFAHVDSSNYPGPSETWTQRWIKDPNVSLSHRFSQYIEKKSTKQKKSSRAFSKFKYFS